MSEHRERQYTSDCSPEIDTDEGWREYRRLVLKVLEDLEQREEKHDIDIQEIKKAVMSIRVDQKLMKQQRYYFSIALGFIFGVISYAIQFYFFTK